MADEPTLGELGRLIGQLDQRFHSRFSELNARLDKVVSMDVYTIQTTHIEQRLAGLQSEHQRCSDAISKLEDDFEQYQRDEAKRREEERQKRLYQGILPVLFSLLSVAVAIWAVVSR